MFDLNFQAVRKAIGAEATDEPLRGPLTEP